jgi:hypothetical protein
MIKEHPTKRTSLQSGGNCCIASFSLSVTKILHTIELQISVKRMSAFLLEHACDICVCNVTILDIKEMVTYGALTLNQGILRSA